MSSRQLRGTDSCAPDQSWSDCTRCSSPRDICLFGTIPSESYQFGFTWDHSWIPLHPLQAVSQHLLCLTIFHFLSHGMKHSRECTNFMWFIATNKLVAYIIMFHTSADISGVFTIHLVLWWSFISVSLTHFTRLAIVSIWIEYPLPGDLDTISLLFW